MTGVTTGQVAFLTATDSDDNESFLTVSLTADLQRLDNFFHGTTGHDHSGAGKGAPISGAGIASGVTLTSPHFVTPTVDSGGLTVTAGGVTITAGGLTVTAGGVTIIAGGLTVNAGGVTALATSTFGTANVGGGIVINTNCVAPTVGAGQLGIGATVSATVGVAGTASAPPASPDGYLIINVSGSAKKLAYYAP